MIREAAIENLVKITKVFGHQWLIQNVVKDMLALQTNSNYLHRLTPLFGIAQLGGLVPTEVVRRQFIPVVQTLTKDKVANVRMNTAKAIKALAVA